MPTTSATAQTITIVAIHADTPLMLSPSESQTVTTSATAIASSAELPPMTSGRRRACFWIIGRAMMLIPVNTSTSRSRAADGQRHVLEHQRGDDQAGGVGDDLDDEPSDEPHARIFRPPAPSAHTPSGWTVDRSACRMGAGSGWWSDVAHGRTGGADDRRDGPVIRRVVLPTLAAAGVVIGLALVCAVIVVRGVVLDPGDLPDRARRGRRLRARLHRGARRPGARRPQGGPPR